MKSINHLFRSFIIVCLALVSCEKVNNPQSRDPEQPDVVVRTISVSFDTKSTRTELDGTQPKFKNKDLIKLAQVDGGAEPQVCTVRVENGVASVETTLEGKLKAVYPYDCAIVSNNKITVSVPTSQDGTFAQAHICMAEQASEDDESLVFHNQTPILRFYVDESIQVQSITITPSSGPAITVSPSSGTHFTSSVLDGPDRRICYAAVPSGINANSFTFTSKTGTQGTVEQTLKATTSLANGTMYNIFIPYYIEINVGSEETPIIQKWGYCNVGAFLPEETGDYFMWGEVKGHKSLGNNSNYAFVTDFEYFEFDESRYNMTTLNRDNGFEDCNIPYYTEDFQGSKYFIEAGESVTLGLEDDAANIIWGSGWRLPTCDEFLDYLGGWEGTTYEGDDFNFKSISFPAAGCGKGMVLSSEQGNYWSSSLCDDEFYPEEGESLSLYAYLLYFIEGECYVSATYRSQGSSIRPIFDASSLTGDIDTITGTLDPMGKVYF